MNQQKLSDYVSWSCPRRPTHHLATLNDVISQGRCLCGQFIRARLKRSNVLNRKAQQRLRNIFEVPANLVVREIFPIINDMGQELETMHPRLYANISRQISNTPWGELTEPDTAPYLLHIVSKDLLKEDINWGKVISLFCITGGLAVDCVQQGDYDYLQQLIDGFTDIIEHEISHWLLENGGWLGLQERMRPPENELTLLGWMTISVSFLLVIYLFAVILKFIGSYLLNKIHI